MPKIIFRFVFTTVLVAIGLFVVRSAHAQTIAIPNTPASLVRVDASGNVQPKRAAANYPDGISLSDCQSDLAIQFQLALTNYKATETLQVWSSQGIDCTQIENREGSTQQCWLVTPGSTPLSAAPLVNVNMRDIIADPSIVGGAFSSTYSAQDATICGKIPYTTFSVYFLLMTGTNVDASVEQDILASTIGPSPPDGFVVSQGNDALNVSWDSIFDEAGTTTAQYVTIFYEPTGLGGMCSTTNLSPTGSETGILSQQEPGTATSAVISGLQNGATYAVGIASQDAFLNVGPISSPECEAPTESAGSGSSGSCAMSVPGNRTSDAAVFFPLAIFGLGAIARSTYKKRVKRNP